MSEAGRPHVNLDAVAAFAAFAECLNFSVAARRLHISQPALHVKIRKLSEQLGVPLYRRDGRSLTLTAAGERAARFGREIGRQTHAFATALRHGVERESLTLAAGEGAYLYLLGGGIRRFLAADAGGLCLSTRDRDGALDAVRSGRAQLGVAPLETVPADLAATPLTDVGQMLVVGSGHPLAKRRRIALNDLAGCALVVAPEERPHRRMLAQLLQSRGVPWTVAVEANGWELMLRFVQMGVGAAIVNACCRLPRGLKGIPIPELPTQRYQLFSLRDAPGSAALQRLIADLRRHGNDWRKP